MKVVELLTKAELPPIYNREGKNCYFDGFRKKLIEITPEETIRQKIAFLLVHKYGVPQEMILLECPMSHYVSGAKGRADIIIHGFDKESEIMYPIAIVECKNSNVLLTDNVVEQAIGYCDILGANYICVTNGIDLELAVYDKDKECYIFLDTMLAYSEMLNNEYEIPEIKEDKLYRFTLDELRNQQLLSEYNYSGVWIFGNDTPAPIRSLSINLYQAFLDIEHKLPVIKTNTFEVLEDIGKRYMDYGNAGGGHYDGIYRAFLVKDRHGEPQIVSFSIFGTDADFRGESRNSYSSLTVAVDRFKISHNSLQYNMDRFVEIKENDDAVFFHNGQISSIKSAEVLNIVENYSQGLNVTEGKIELGKLNVNKVLFLDDKEVAGLIYNLIEYALLRDELRQNKRKEK